MNDDKQTKIDIPESIDGYTVTLFWGLTIVQIVLLFLASLFVGFGIFGIVAKQIFSSIGLFLLAGAFFLGIAKIRGRNFYRHIAFIIGYYRTKPRVLIYHHYAPTVHQASHAKGLVAQTGDHRKTYLFIIIALVIGILLIPLIIFYLYYVTH